MKKRIKRIHTLLFKKHLRRSIAVVAAIVVLVGAGVTATFAYQQNSPDSQQPIINAGQRPAKIEKEQSKIETIATPAATTQTPTESAKPMPGTKKLQTKQEEQAMQSCVQNDSVAYAKYYANHSAEVQRHQTALATFNAAYNISSNQYKGVYYSGTQATDLYNADIANENLQFQQTTAAIYATYETEKSPAAC